MIHVVAVITTEAGKRRDVLNEFEKIIPLVHAEKGCIEYQPVTDAVDAGKMQTPAGPDTFIVVEKWATMADLHAHSAADHMAEYAKKVGPIIKDRRVHVLQ